MTTLCDVIGWIESKNVKTAIRFEPAVYAKSQSPSKAAADILATIRTVHNCSAATAQMLYSTSFGEFQIMGFNLWNMSISKKIKFSDYLNDVVLQEAVFEHFVRSKDINFTIDELQNQVKKRILFASVYNGSIAYEANIKSALIHYGLNPS